MPGSCSSLIGVKTFDRSSRPVSVPSISRLAARATLQPDGRLIFAIAHVVDAPAQRFPARGPLECGLEAFCRISPRPRASLLPGTTPEVACADTRYHAVEALPVEVHNPEMVAEVESGASVTPSHTLPSSSSASPRSAMKRRSSRLLKCDRG